LTHSPGLRHQLFASRAFLAALLLCAAFIVGFAATRIQAPASLGQPKGMTDFDAFYVAGAMARNGKAVQTYDAQATFAAQRAFTGTQSAMPWTYPPPFTVLMEQFSRLPVGIAFAIFTSLGFLFWLMVMHRLAGAYLPGAVIAVLPTVILNLRTGQNGFLIAGLFGLALLLHRGGKASAGLPLGLMIVKPHLTAGIGVLTLLDRRWHALALAAVIALALLALATLAYGPAIWPAFLEGLRQASEFLAQGHYQLFRMTSWYAFLRGFDLPAGLALAAQVVSAIAGLALLALTWRARARPHVVGAAACVASLLFSPYSYDYDLTILGVAVALLITDMARLARPAELAAMFALCWWVTGYGLAANSFLEIAGLNTAALQKSPVPSLAAPALLALIALAATVLRRGERGGAREKASAGAAEMETSPS